MILNRKELENNSACIKAIEFLERNDLLNREISKIEGDYEGWYSWYRNNIRTFEYDDKGNKVREIYPDGDVREYKYNDKGNKIKEIFPDGSIYEREYDADGNLVREIHPDGDIIKLEYDDKGNMVRKTYPNGTTRKYEYTWENDKLFVIKKNDEVICTVIFK